MSATAGFGRHWCGSTILPLAGPRAGWLVLRYLQQISGYSRQTITRLVAQYRKNGKIQRRQRTVAGFQRYYTPQD
ncbi:MAG: hypothetical protein KZQ95_14035, partial [Candidatus Thiodiazotropha sp. (ex Epidulcina cf. delphinae)]|nr:hypothetical protein [Candidatus Thiodiazotropha sp. (ex Epidulcina cf. delphinae)]